MLLNSSQVVMTFVFLTVQRGMLVEDIRVKNDNSKICPWKL